LLFHWKCRTITKEFIGCFDTLAVSTVQRRSMRWWWWFYRWHFFFCHGWVF
jgi:hypothetical protein